MTSTNSTPEANRNELPNNHMTLSIASFVLGLLSGPIGIILGIFAIYSSNRATKYFKTGNFGMAENAAKNAKTLAYLAIASAVIALIILILNYDNINNWFDGVYIDPND